MKKALSLGLLSVCLFINGASYAQVNPYLAPERVNPRLNTAMDVSKLIKDLGHSKVAVVFMENSELCAIFAGALVSALRLRGVDAYYVRGGEKLREQLTKINPDSIYIAYFGERPIDEVQKETIRDLRTMAETYAFAQKLPKLLVHPSTFQQGFIAGSLVDDKVNTLLENLDITAFTIQDGKVLPVKLVVKDFEIKVSEIKPNATQQKRKTSR